jgi:four helix bundle protein
MKTPARSFRELIVWQKAHRFVLEVYRFTRGFPSDEKFGLTSQIHRAAVSVPANIAEGFPKRGASDKTRFFNIAQGSLEEVHYYLILSKDLGYGDSAKLLELYDEVGRLLNGYISAILTSRS